MHPIKIKISEDKILILENVEKKLHWYKMKDFSKIKTLDERCEAILLNNNQVLTTIILNISIFMMKI